MEDQIVHVPMAGIVVVENGAKVKTTLGSCVGVIIHDKLSKRTGLAHIMLPKHYHSDEAIGKYADTAIPALLKELARRGSSKAHLEAYLTGGADMFARSEDRRLTSVGEMNIGATRDLLTQHGVSVVYEDTGGSRGRVVQFDNGSAQIQVRTLNPPTFERRKR